MPFLKKIRSKLVKFAVKWMITIEDGQYEMDKLIWFYNLINIRI